MIEHLQFIFAVFIFISGLIFLLRILRIAIKSDTEYKFETIYINILVIIAFLAVLIGIIYTGYTNNWSLL